MYITYIIIIIIIISQRFSCLSESTNKSFLIIRYVLSITAFYITVHIPRWCLSSFKLSCSRFEYYPLWMDNTIYRPRPIVILFSLFFYICTFLGFLGDAAVEVVVVRNCNYYYYYYYYYYLHIFLLTYLLTYSMEQSPSWESNRF